MPDASRGTATTRLRAPGAIAVAPCVLASVVPAATLHVDAVTGSDAADGLAWSSPTATIGEALARAASTPEPDERG